MLGMLKRILIVLVPAVCCASVLSAGVIYSNIGPGYPGDLSDLANIGVQGGPGFSGTEFTTTGGGNLASIVIDLSQSPGQQGPLTMGLYNTTSSGEPGSLLEGWSISVPVFHGTVTPLTTFTSVLHPLLSARVEYWFVVETETSSSADYLFNDQGVSGGLWVSTFDNIDSLVQQFSTYPTPGIEVTSTPEPTTGLLLAVGGLALLVSLTQKKKGRE